MEKSYRINKANDNTFTGRKRTMETATKPIRITPEMHRELKALAARKGTKLAQEAEKAIQGHLKAEQKKDERRGKA
jgi:hypothetical protein